MTLARKVPTQDLHLLYLPYTIDLSIYTFINTPELIEHIERVGKVLYPIVYL